MKSDKEYKDHLYALVLAGGGGTRLWPHSRNATPKQFLKFFQEKTFTQNTLRRMNKALPWERIYVITSSEAYRDEIAREVPHFKSENILVEPMRRDTAAAYALGALYISKKDSKAVIINEAADHIEAPSDYFEIVDVAAQAAFKGDWLVAVGVKPNEPHTGYGYIKRGRKFEVIGKKTVYKLDKFTEKPKLNLATRFLHSGKYYWNAAHYVWSASSLLRAVEKHAPQISKPLGEISKAIGTPKEKEVLKKGYKKMPKVSVDYAISEKANNFLLVTTDERWTDIGDWEEVWEHSPKDNNGNVILRGGNSKTRVISVETTDSLALTSGRLIALVGLKDTVVVDTKDALLVVSKDHAQKVKQVVQKLKEEKMESLL